MRVSVCQENNHAPASGHIYGMKTSWYSVGSAGAKPRDGLERDSVFENMASDESEHIYMRH